MNLPPKILIIRLSSFGDILQCLGVPAALKRSQPESQIDWVVRSDFAQLLEPHPLIHTVWSFEKKSGFWGWLKMCREISRQNYTHVYDAHSNLRSRLLMAVLTMSFRRPVFFVRRSKERWRRFLLFRFRINRFPMPYRGQISFLTPLKKWGVKSEISTEPQLFFNDKTLNQLQSQLNQLKPFVAIAPSAAWKMKRWPVEKWQELVKSSTHRFVVLGGPEDQFCQKIADVAPDRVFNFAGRLSLLESCAALSFAQAAISADTGLLHAADLLGRPSLALIGPTAFGYPSHPQSRVLEVDLNCKPCSKDGRGKCRQAVYQKCMLDLSPKMVADQLNRVLNV